MNGLYKAINHCLRKRVYKTLRDAESARKFMIYMHMDNRFQAYKCKLCTGYHVGKHNDKPKPPVITFPDGWDTR